MKIYIGGLGYSGKKYFIDYIKDSPLSGDLVSDIIPTTLRGYDLSQVNYVYFVRDIRICCLIHYLTTIVQRPFIDPLTCMQEYLQKVIVNDYFDDLLYDSGFYKRNVLKFEETMTPAGVQNLASILEVPTNAFNSMPESSRMYDTWFTYKEKYEVGHLIEEQSVIDAMITACTPYQSFIDDYGYNLTTPTLGDLAW